MSCLLDGYDRSEIGRDKQAANASRKKVWESKKKVSQSLVKISRKMIHEAFQTKFRCFPIKTSEPNGFEIWDFFSVNAYRSRLRVFANSAKSFENPQRLILYAIECIRQLALYFGVCCLLSPCEPWAIVSFCVALRRHCERGAIIYFEYIRKNLQKWSGEYAGNLFLFSA